MLHIAMKKSFSLCIAVMAMIFSFVSCKTSGPEDVSALVTVSGEPAGFVITYDQIIDKSSVSTGSYSVEGYEVGKVFASTVNPFVEEKREGEVSYVVVLLRATETPRKLEEVSVCQVKEIKTAEGKEVPAWKESFRAANAYPIPGGLMTK